MYNKYLATPADLETVTEALKIVMNSKMRFVFKNKSKIKNTVIVSYDCRFIYIWKIYPVKLINKIPHKVTVLDDWQSGWWANLVFKKLEKYLPHEIRKSTRFDLPIVSGGFLTPFIELHKKKDFTNNPYTTRESYLATIIHEFGHIYWNSYKLWWLSNKKENLDYLNVATKLYSSKDNIPNNLSFCLPSPLYLSEVFAFCTEYYASEIFWKNHKRNIDISVSNHLDTLTTIEKEKNLDKENSVIEPTTSPHDFASVLGKAILIKYPNNWPAILTKSIKI